MRGVASLRGPPQAAVVEHGVPRLGALRRQRGEGGVLPHLHHADPPEPPDVAELEHPTIVERPPRPHVRIELTRPHAQHAGHPQVHHQLAVVVERQQQVLASTPHRVDARARRERRR